MKYLSLLVLGLLASPAFAQTYTAGTLVATVTSPTSTANPVFVPASPTVAVMQCSTASLSCWPSAAGSIGPSVPLSSATNVFAIVPPATTPQWVAVASITTSTTTTPPPGTLTSGIATLTWQAPTAWQDLSPLSGFNVYMGANSCPATALLNPTPLPASTLTFTESGLTNGETYCFAVTSVDAAGVESVQSSPVTGTVPAAVVIKPVAPTNFTVTFSVSGK